MPDSNTLQELYLEYKNKPQSSIVHQSVIDTIKNSVPSQYHTLLVFEILRISAPSKVLTHKLIEKAFLNIIHLEVVHLMSLLDLITTYKIAHLLAEKSFLHFVNSVISNLKNGVDFMERIILNYLEERKSAAKQIFELCEKNIKTELARRLIRNRIFDEYVRELDERRLINIAEHVKNYRYIKNRIHRRKYLMSVFGDHVCRIGNKASIPFENLGLKQTDGNENKKVDWDKENMQENDNSRDDTSFSENLFGSEYIFGNDNRVTCRDYRELYELYKEDIIGKLILARRRTCCDDCIIILNELADCSDARVRSRAVKYLPFDPYFILDISKEVRSVMFNRILNDNIIEGDDEILLTLFKGYMTKAGNEYRAVIDQLQLDFNFLYKHRKKPGIKLYLSKKGLATQNDKIRFNHQEIRKNKSEFRFFIKYMNLIELDDKSIGELIRNDSYCAYLYLKRNFIYNSDKNELLLKSIKNCDNLKHYLRMIKFLSKHIRENYCFAIENLKTEQDFYYNSCFDGINPDDLDTIMSKFESSFPVSYFLAKYSKSSQNVFGFIDNYIKEEVDIFKVFQIIIESNNKELLISNFDRLFEFSMDNKHRKLFAENITAVSILIFFFRSGGIKNYNKHFVLETILVLCRALKEMSPSNLNKVKQIYRTYYNLLDSENKESLHSLVFSLKNYSTIRNYDGYEIKGDKIDTNLLPRSDKILYCVCDIINSFYTKKCEVKESIRCSSLFEIDEKYKPIIESTDFCNKI